MTSAPAGWDPIQMDCMCDLAIACLRRLRPELVVPYDAEQARQAEAQRQQARIRSAERAFIQDARHSGVTLEQALADLYRRQQADPSTFNLHPSSLEETP